MPLAPLCSLGVAMAAPTAAISLIPLTATLLPTLVDEWDSDDAEGTIISVTGQEARRRREESSVTHAVAAVLVALGDDVIAC